MDNTFQPNEEYRKEIDELKSRLREVREAPGAVRNGKTGMPGTAQAEGKKAGTRYDPDHPYRVFFDHMSEGAATLTEEGILLSGNDRFARMLGLPREELIGASFYDIAVPPEYHAVIDNLIARCVVYDADTAVSCTALLRSPQGAAHPVNLSLNRTSYNGSRVLCMIVTDLAEQNRTNEFRTLTENIPDVITRLDRGLRHTYINPAISRLTGNPPEYYVGKTLRESVRIFDAEQTEACARKAFETGETVIQDFRSVRPGVEKYCSVSFVPERGPGGDIVSLLCVLHDITSLRQAEEIARGVSERFALLSETAGELLQSNEPQKVFESLCRKVMEQLDCHVFFNFLVDEKAGKLRLNACAGIPGEEVKKIEWLDYGAAVCGCVARDGCRIVAEHIPSTPDPRTELVKSFGIKAYACHPLLAEGGAVIGTLSFGSKTHETFNDDALALMKAVADQVSAALVRMRTEQALRESEERFRTLIEASPEGITYTDAEAKILYANRKAAEMHGYGYRDEFIGKSAFSLIDTAEQKRALDNMERTAATGFLENAEYRLLRKDGSGFPGEMNVQVIRDAQGHLTGFIGISRDITERKKTEKRIGWLSTFPEYNPNPVVEVDPAGNVTYANEAAKTIFPGLAETGSGHPALAGVLSLLDKLKTAEGKKYARDTEIEGCWFHQTLHYVDTFDRLRIYMVDITERKRAEEALQESDRVHAFQSAILASVRDPLWATDPGLRIVYWNDAATKTFGWTADEAQGRHAGELFRTLVPGSTRDNAAAQLLQTGDYRGEVVCHCKDGRPVIAEASSRVVHGPDGEVVRVVNTARDITERKKAEEALRESEQKLAAELDISMQLGALSGRLISGDDTKDLYEQMLDTAMSIMHSDRASLQVFCSDSDTGDQVLHLLAWRGFHPQSARFWETVRMKGDSVCSAALSEGRRVVIADVGQGPAEGSPDYDEYRRSGIRAVQSTPLISRSGKLLGMISTHWNKPHEPSVECLNLFDVLARQVADQLEHVRTKEALQESEKKYREIVKFASAAIFEVDFRERRFTSVNDALCLILGYTREELLALDINDILDDRSRGLLRERMNARLNREELDEDVEYTCRTKDGREIHALLNVTFVVDGEGRPVSSTVIGHDITERKNMEEQLRRKEEEVRTLIEHSPDIIFRLDTSLRYLFVNPAVERNLGIPAGSFIGNTFDLVGFDDETVAAWQRQCEDVLASGREQTLEFSLKANGETKYLFSRLIPERGSDGVIVSLLGITSDITELKRKEQQLIALNELYRKAKEEYQRLIDTANSIILRWSPDGTLKFVNDYGLKFFGYAKKELMGKNAQFLIPGTDSSGGDLSDLVLKITREPDKHSYSENENVKKSGERAWVMWTNKAIIDEQGNLKEILAIGTDITVLKKTQEELRHHKEALETLVEKRTQELLKTHAELERTRRMADIGRLASTIAHELRNPLSGIKTAAYNIQRKSDAALLGKHIETINKKVQESDFIINNLLGFTRIKTLLHEPFKLQEVVRDCIAGVSAKYAKWSVTVAEDFRCDHDDVIEADFTQIRMLISNLLDNAFQALPDKSGHVSVSVSRDGMHYRIAVSDNGTGIAEEEREKIFEPFYTTKSKGTGLGLTVCREIVDLHGGTITISSALGKGTTFVVTLPAAQPFPRGDGRSVNQPSVIN